MAQAVSHLIFSTPAETFVAIEDEAGRLPLANVHRCGSRIEWLRADGGAESMDVSGSPSRDTLLANFESPQGLLLALYSDLARGGQAVAEEPSFLVISASGVIFDDNAQGRYPCTVPEAAGARQ